MFGGKERHERGEMPGAFWEKDARNPEKAPVFWERQGGSDEKHPLFPEGKRQNGQGNPGENLQE